MVAWIWVLIPLAALTLAGFSEWLKFKREAADLNTSTHELEAGFEALQAANRDLVERIQNLEAIVTSEAWEGRELEADVSGSGHRLNAPPLLDLDEPEAPSDQDRAARLARRLRRS